MQFATNHLGHFALTTGLHDALAAAHTARVVVVLLAASPVVEGVSGRYFEDCEEAGPFTPGVRRGVADFALDPDNAARLWQLSLDMLATAQPGDYGPPPVR
jgi:hypothetical protein